MGIGFLWNWSLIHFLWRVDFWEESEFLVAGSLIKLVYFCKSSGGYDNSCVETEGSAKSATLGVSNGSSNGKRPILEGRLHFAKFETSKIDDCLEFISSKKLHCDGMYVCFSAFMSLTVSVTNFALIWCYNIYYIVNQSDN